MKKVMVIGCPGSGKSTFSKKLHEITKLPLYHLDMMYWNPDRSKVPKEVFLLKLREVVEKETFIIDGNYESTLELRMIHCDTIIFLDYEMDVCLEGILSRRGSKRTDMPWVEKIDELDEDFIRFVKEYHDKSRPIVMRLLEKYSDRDIQIFYNRSEADLYLSGLQDA